MDVPERTIDFGKYWQNENTELKEDKSLEGCRFHLFMKLLLMMMINLFLFFCCFCYCLGYAVSQRISFLMTFPPNENPVCRPRALCVYTWAVRAQAAWTRKSCATVRIPSEWRTRRERGRESVSARVGHSADLKTHCALEAKSSLIWIVCFDS